MTDAGRDKHGRAAPDPTERRQAGDRPWTQIWFDDPDEAYLVAAAIRRHLNAVVRDVVLVPSSRGPALELPARAARDPLVVALARRFGGHFDRRGAHESGASRGANAVGRPTAVSLEKDIQ